MGEKRIDYRIETLRAFAILFVVQSHMINDAEMASAATLYDYVTQFVQNVRLPLFTVISGYLYGQRPVGRGRFTMFIKGKVRRILFPLFVVSSLEYLTVSLMPGVNNPERLADIWKIYCFPYEHYWFLQVIFLIFVIVGILDWAGLLKRNNFLGLFFAISVALYLFYKKLGMDLTFFSLGTVTYLLPFFLIGYISSSRAELLGKMVRSPFLISLLVCGVLLQQLDWFFDFPYESSKRSIVGIMIGLSGTALLLRHRFLYCTRCGRVGPLRRDDGLDSPADSPCADTHARPQMKSRSSINPRDTGESSVRGENKTE